MQNAYREFLLTYFSLIIFIQGVHNFMLDYLIQKEIIRRSRGCHEMSGLPTSPRNDVLRFPRPDSYPAGDLSLL